MSCENIFPIKVGSVGDWIFVQMGLDLTGATTPRVSMKNRVTGVIEVNNAVAQIANGTYVLNRVPTALTPASGVIFYPWVSGDIDTVGDYDMQFSAVTAQGLVIRPPSGFATIVVEAAI